MAGRRPKWQIFKTTPDTKIDYKNDKIGALWAGENQYGEYFTGKIGDQSVVVYRNKFFNPEEDGPDGNGHENPISRADTTEYPETAEYSGQVPTPDNDDDLPF
jgi:hypothetical protein